MRLAFIDPVTWDYRIETPYQHPLGGSQSALCYLAEELVRQGHEVFLLNHATLAGISRGVVCLPVTAGSAELFQSLALDAAIVLNSVIDGQQIKPLLAPHTRLVCWLQSAHDQSSVAPLSQPAMRDRFDGIALVSDWQRQQFQTHFNLEQIPVGVLRNAIAPSFHHLFANEDSILGTKSRPPVLAYTSTPFRGLELLLDLFPLIQKTVPEVQLRVFSSMAVYQQPDADERFRALYRRCQGMTGVEYVGSLPQPDLARELQTATVLVYPNIFLETSCIAALEAMASGCQVITSDLGALPETTAGFAHLIPIPATELASPKMVNFTAAGRQTYITHFVAATVQVLHACTQPNTTALEAKLQRQVASVNASPWSMRAREWVAWLSKLGQERSPIRLGAAPLESRAAVAPVRVEGDAGEVLEQAAQLGQTGRLAEAAAICQQVLQQQPDHARAWNLLGLAVFQQGQGQQALECMERAIALDPTAAEFHSHLGVMYCNQGRLGEGIVCYQQALSLQPQSIDIRYNLALALHRQGDLDSAIAHYQAILALQPHHAQVHLNLGNLLQQQSQFDGAIAHYQQALAVRPAHAETWLRLGAARQAQSDPEEAVRCYQQALALNPDYADVHNNLGTVLHELGQAQQAIAHYQHALAAQPNFPYALINLGNILLRLERFAEAEAAYRQLLRLEPANLKALDGLVKLLRQTCQWSDIEALSTRLITVSQLLLEKGLPCSVMPLNTLLLPFSPAQQQAIARDEAQAIAQTMAERRQQFKTQNSKFKTQNSKLRLGYVSGDFRDHAVAHLMLQLFRLHDRRQFEVYAYSIGPDDGSAYRQKLAEDCDRFMDIATFTPVASAQQVFDDGIHILVDLAGYTEYNCPRLFALHPAPIQVNYLGYPGTLGADYIDYILTDAVLTPADAAPFFTEQCVYLPHCYQINDNQQMIDPPPPRSTLGLPEQGFVYCCFNNTRKIDPFLFATWMRILEQVPHSVLWLYQSYPEAEINLTQAAEVMGIGGDRLVFAQRQPKTQHLTRLQCADLVLDTRFYNAHTTASDALWAGVPLITLMGETFASRVAASLLTAIDLPELITHTLTDYERLAIHLGQHPQAMQPLKAKLAGNRLTMPLFDTERSVRHLEQAFRMMWERYEAGRSPQSFVVPTLS